MSSGRTLAWVQQPTRVRLPAAISPPPVVEVRLGPVPDPRIIDGEVQLIIDQGPPGATLRGNVARCPGGVATFDNLRPSTPGEYVFRPVCDESKLEVIPRPSSYRYYGAFDLTVGQQVEIMGDGSTTGSVSEVGDGYIIVQDNSATPQQGVVAGAEGVTVGGVPAEHWFAADAPGLDVDGSLGLWTADPASGAGVEALGRTANIASSDNLTFVASPLGSLHPGVVAEGINGQWSSGASLFGDGVAVGLRFTLLCLMKLPARSTTSVPRRVLRATHNQSPTTAGELRSVLNTDSVVRRSSEIRLPTPVLTGAGEDRWTLIGFECGGNGFRIYQDGLEVWSTSSSTTGHGLITGVEAAIGNACVQLGLYPGFAGAIPTPEWHLEQARRCGVAP